MNKRKAKLRRNEKIRKNQWKNELRRKKVRKAKRLQGQRMKYYKTEDQILKEKGYVIQKRGLEGDRPKEHSDR